MVGHSDMVAPTWGTRMARNPLTAMEYLDRLPRCANVNLLFDQGEGDGIPRAIDFNMIVGRHTSALTQSQIGRAKT